jgi:tellurite resistance protein TehA-like permease
MMGGWGYRGWGMPGPGGMMNNWGYSSSPLGWIGMIFMWLIPIGLIVLALFGIVWLVRKIRSAKA